MSTIIKDEVLENGAIIRHLTYGLNYTTMCGVNIDRMKKSSDREFIILKRVMFPEDTQPSDKCACAICLAHHDTVMPYTVVDNELDIV